MAVVTLQEVNARLRDIKGSARWEAGETSVSHLALQEAPGMAYFGIGASDSELTQIQESFSVFPGMAAPPPRIDWRNHGGKNFVTPIRNQLNCGSCVAFASCASLESRDAVRTNTPSPTLDLSEAHLFYCGCGACCKSGWQPALALDFAKRTGVALESSFPYTPGNQPCKPGISPHLVITSHSATTASVARRTAISSDGPVVAALKVFRDFLYYKEGVYTPVTNELVGLHAVCVVGYDDVAQYWIVKNSWGPGWGAGGFGRIAYGTTCDIDTTYPFWIPEL